MKVFKITTNLTKSRLNHINDICDSYDLELIEKIDEFPCYDFYIDGLMASYIIVYDDLLDEFIYFLQKYKVKYTCEDITKLFLYGQIEIKHEDFHKYKKDNLDTDTILDKINELGIDSLTELDKTILKAHS